MDKLTHYRTLVMDHLHRIAESIARRPQPGTRTFCAFDVQHDQYLLVKTGWVQNHRVRLVPIHVRLEDGKVWIEEDGTEDGIASYLLGKGVPREDLVLGFQHPSMRDQPEPAVA
jgi:hypothetical protein